MLRDAANVQALWGALLVEELRRCGVDYFVIAPGSRSTPLVQAVARHPGAEAVLWADERGAAFHALGYGRATRTPAAVITTSGTAVANLWPAVMEASQDGVPLLLLTADRPPELREVGANQSVRQAGIFHEHVRWAFDLPVPDERTPARMLLTTVDHAVARAAGERAPGPVHLNCPFREPLAPSEQAWDASCLDGLERWIAGQEPFTWSSHMPPEDVAPAEWLRVLSEELQAIPDGLLVVGHDAMGTIGDVAMTLAQRLGWPLWPDVRSNLRLGAPSPFVMPHLDRALGRGFSPRAVLQLGGRITSRRVQAFLDAGQFERYVLVESDPARHDPSHRVTDRHVLDAARFSHALGEVCAQDGAWHAQPPATWRAFDDRARRAVAASVEGGEELSEPWVARWISQHLHPQHGLFLSNSMPVRDVQDYGATDGARVAVAANRGASGIDGIVSSAAGYAQGRDAPVTLLIGDMALLHDVNALAFLAHQEMPVAVVVLNNGGGSIFSFLPIAAHGDVMTPWVQSPHQLHFEGVCLSFGIHYDLVEDREAFVEAYRRAIGSGRSSVIEVASSLAGNREEHARIETAIAEALDGP